jgi:predicted nucleotidyltransferase
MRLTTQQINLIKTQSTTILGEQARVYLFGSRVDDTKKGGDIDLFVELDAVTENMVAKILQLNGALQMALGMQKIDIVFHAPNYARQAIHDIAKQQGILL